MDAISQGFDEHGAYAKVEKKHGKVLADAVWAEAQAEMKAIKKNPRNSKFVTKVASKLVVYINHDISEIVFNDAPSGTNQGQLIKEIRQEIVNKLSKK